MLDDLALCQLCAAIYATPPLGQWDNIWPTRFGYAGHKRIDGIDYLIRRGSQTVEDWLVDFDITPVQTPIGGMHAGFYGDVLWTRHRIESVIGERYVLAGHSLGAAESAVHGAILTHEHRSPERIVLFGCPRPYYWHARQVLADAKVPVVSYVAPGDPVPDVPPWSPFQPYQEPWQPTHLKDFTDPADTGLFRAHHIQNYEAGVRALTAATAPAPPPAVS